MLEDDLRLTLAGNGGEKKPEDTDEPQPMPVHQMTRRPEILR